MIDMEQALRNIGKASDIPQVSLEPVVIKNEDTNYVAVVEDKSNQTLGIASKKYQLVQHRDVYDAITKLNGYKIRSAKLYKNGARMIIEIEDVIDAAIHKSIERYSFNVTAFWRHLEEERKT